MSYLLCLHRKPLHFDDFCRCCCVQSNAGFARHVLTSFLKYSKADFTTALSEAPLVVLDCVRLLSPPLVPLSFPTHNVVKALEIPSYLPYTPRPFSPQIHHPLHTNLTDTLKTTDGNLVRPLQDDRPRHRQNVQRLPRRKLL